MSELRSADPESMDSNGVARRRVLESEDDLLHCEHAGNKQAEATAVDHSARLVERWETTQDPVERKYLLERVGREMMTVHEAPPAPVIAREMPRNELGAHNNADFTTDMNDWQLKQDDPRVALETYLHEYRHVEQHYEVLKSHGSSGHLVEPERSMAMAHNLDDYIRSESDQAAYEGQLVEADAERFGTTAAGEILERRDEIRDLIRRDSSHTSDADAIAAQRLAVEKRSR